MRSFAGLELDPESGFLFSGARLFAPRLGRFLGEDPGAAQSGSNGFLLFGNDPAALR
jgi:RHS repeat-associated protein